jgi:mono/diheme cytochrome c family protein
MSSSPRRILAPVCACWLIGLCALSGCTKTDPPQFRTNMQDITIAVKAADPNAVKAGYFQGVAVDIKSDDSAEVVEQKKKDAKRRVELLQNVVTVVYALFGEPDKPYVVSETDLNQRKIEMSAGPYGGDASGKQRGLYRQHCAHCHGVTGDGAGPTAAFLNPYPRDYRRGIYKFKSTEFASKPTSGDLKRTLIEGIPGTAMPSFALLPNDEVESLVEYVRYLSIRGETELALARKLFIDEDEPNSDLKELVSMYVVPVADPWKEADKQTYEIPERPAMAATPTTKKEWFEKGDKIFHGEVAKCATCHGPTALGDGSEKKLFDDWNNFKVDAQGNPLVSERHIWLLPPQELKPRNLRLGIYRGGRRPVDLYRRINAGIYGAQMPAQGPGPGRQAALKPEEIWAVIDYIRSLPYDAISETGQHVATVEKPRN